MKVKPPVQGVPRELLSLETLWEALHLCVWRQGSPIQLLTEQFHLAAGVNTHDRVFCVTSIRCSGARSHWIECDTDSW